jgi:hypothetical protein
MKQAPKVDRLTVLVDRDDIRQIKHLAVDRGTSTSEIVRNAVGDYLKLKGKTEAVETDRK